MARVILLAAALLLVACGGDEGEERPPAWCCEEDDLSRCYDGARTVDYCDDMNNDGKVDRPGECLWTSVDWQCGSARCGEDGIACYFRERLPECDCEGRDFCPQECTWLCAWAGEFDPAQGCRPARVTEFWIAVGGGTKAVPFEACLPPDTDCI